MPRLLISVDDETFRRLVGRAVDARRDARDEAALLVERALRRDVKATRPPSACPDATAQGSADGPLSALS